MNAIEVGKRLVELTSADNDAQALAELYADNVVSIESAHAEDQVATWEGISAVHEKHEWWSANATVHETTAEGPYAGFGDDHFVVKFWMDVTMDGQRNQMSEVGLYTVEAGKIVREVYLPLLD